MSDYIERKKLASETAFARCQEFKELGYFEGMPPGCWSAAITCMTDMLMSQHPVVCWSNPMGLHMDYQYGHGSGSLEIHYD
jgi:hypothetical protein